MASKSCCKLLLWALALSTLFWGSIVGTIFWFHGEKLLSLFRGEDRGMQATLDVLKQKLNLLWRFDSRKQPRTEIENYHNQRRLIRLNEQPRTKIGN